MPMKTAGHPRVGVSVSSPSFTLTSWPFGAPKTPVDDGRQRVMAGQRMFNRASGQLAYGISDPVPVDEWEQLISEADFDPVLRGETPMPPPRPYGHEPAASAQPRRVRTRGSRK